MTTSLPMHFLIVVFAGWLNRQQQAVIEYLKTENEILKSQLKVLTEGCKPPEGTIAGSGYRDAHDMTAYLSEILADVRAEESPEESMVSGRRLVGRESVQPARQTPAERPQLAQEIKMKQSGSGDTAPVEAIRCSRIRPRGRPRRIGKERCRSGTTGSLNSALGSLSPLQ